MLRKDWNALRRILRSKPASRLFGLVMTLAMSLILSSLLIQHRSMEDRFRTQRQWYGAWQAVLLEADDAAIQETWDNLAVDRVGIVQTVSCQMARSSDPGMICFSIWPV